MRVTLADTAIMVEGWRPEMDAIGEYTLKVRKTPEEMKEERRIKKDRTGQTNVRINRMRCIPSTVISKDENDPTVAYFLPGLWPRVENWLKGRGMEYEVLDCRNKDIRPELDVSALDGITLRENQDVALALISIADCGIIETCTGFGKSLIIAILCKAYPTLNIVVTTGSAQVVATLYDYIKTFIPGEVGYLYAKGDTTSGKRVIVTTFKSLPNIPPEKVHLVLVDEAHGVGQNQVGAELAKFCFARRFGFSASPIRNDGSGLVLESILGPTILKMSYQESVDAGMVTNMKYYMLPCSGCPQVARNSDLPDVMQKRFSYWVNQSRNNAIRDLVYDIKKVYDGQILIMVTTLEHAIQLHLKLPWFQVAYYGATSLESIRKKFPKEKYPGLDLSRYKTTAKQLDIMRNAFAKGTLRYCIATKTWKQGVNFKHLEVMIRADGDTSGIECIQIPGRLSRLDDGKDAAYLIDVDDQFSPWAARRSKSRDDWYQKQEWQRISHKELIDDLSSKRE